MIQEKELFKRFNRTNLVDEISKTIPISRSVLRKEVKEFLWPRLDFLHGKSSRSIIYYIFEESYIETEWKDMISIHYINTSYKVQNSVMRVHLFLEPELTSDSYMGFFTLRKIDEARIMLSYIFPDWSKLYYKGQRLCVMSYKKTVHIMGRELSFNTYPLFVQDNITVACSQVNMISMTLYLHEKFDYRRIRISKLNDSFSLGKTKLFPTSGLTPTQMIEIFNVYNISLGHYALPASVDEDSTFEKCHNYIDYTVESGIPVILGMQIKDENEKGQRHVIQIIGHTQQNRNEYVIYDDSGYFLRNVLEEDGFVSAIEWNTLKHYMSLGKSFILYPIHEKVYLMYDNFKESFEHLLKNTMSLAGLEEKGYLNKKNIRFLLADNGDVKCFLREKVLPKIKDRDLQKEEYRLQKKEIENMLMIDMPHYVWLCELPITDGYFLFVADSTYGRFTTKNIFFNLLPIYTDEQFGLLNYSFR